MRARRMIYKAVEKMVLLYENKIWVMMGVILNVLEGVHHWSDKHITVTKAWRL